MPNYLFKRKGFWQFCRRVPLALAHLDGRVIVKATTGVRVSADRNGIRAGRIAERMNADLEAYWGGLAAGRGAEAQRRYDEARIRARALGFDYAPAAQIAERSLDEVLARLERLAERGMVEDAGAVSAVLGGEQPADILLSELFGVFEGLTRAERRDMSEEQVRKWQNPKKRAIANLISVVGDKQIRRLARGDAMDFRSWWQDRVLDEELDIDTANKDFGHLNRMFRVVNRGFRLGLEPAFADLRLEGRDDVTRTPFDPDFVQSVILADLALASLNAEARRVIYVMADTGLRPSEIVNLDAETIRLDAEVPHVQVRPDGRRLKTPQSLRDIPLVGSALAALRAQPEGFPRYRHKAASLSALVNKFLTNHGMRPTERHSLYSLRHTFKDRLRAVEAPEEMVDEFMGHKNEKPQYGKGYPLWVKQQWLQRIAFRPPVEV